MKTFPGVMAITGLLAAALFSQEPAPPAPPRVLPEILIDENPDSPPRVSGVGFMLRNSNEPGVVEVGEIIPGSPADLSLQFKEGDRILAVAEEGLPPQPLTGLSLGDVAALIRGAEGTALRLTIAPANKPVSETLDVMLLRSIVKVKGPPPHADTWPPAEGEVAPELTYQKLGDPKATATLAAERGKRIVVLAFWATWSGTSRQVVADLQQIAEKFADQKDKVLFLDVAIDADADAGKLPAVVERVTAHVRQAGWAHTAHGWSAPEGRRIWRLRTVPSTFVIGKDGLVGAVTAIPRVELEAILRKLLANTPDAGPPK